jgi:menaquinone-9 beta-reductase
MAAANYDTDVLIAGGGPAGLAAAIGARRLGMRVMLVEAGVPGSIDKCCGEGLMPDGLAALRALGIRVPAAAAGRFTGIEFHDGARVAQGGFRDGGVGFGIRRTTLHGLLADATDASGAECLFGTKVTALADGGVLLNGQRKVRARWIVAADGYQSRIREWAGLNRGRVVRRVQRYGFRKHFAMANPPKFVELYFGVGFQAFVTPIGESEAGLAVTTSNPSFRVDRVLDALPALRERLGGQTSSERGAITGTHTLPAVWNGNVALLGDASGGVDSITGEGLCLALRQADALVHAIEKEDLDLYARAHQRILRAPRAMASLLLLLAEYPVVRRAAMSGLVRFPGVFDRLLSAHAIPASERRGEVL